MICPMCQHSLENNLYGLDQNDVWLDDEGKLVHSGCCTYCAECNPVLKSLHAKQPQTPLDASKPSDAGEKHDTQDQLEVP